jgi:hypothetical protein
MKPNRACFIPQRAPEYRAESGKVIWAMTKVNATTRANNRLPLATALTNDLSSVSG